LANRNDCVREGGDGSSERGCSCRLRGGVQRHVKIADEVDDVTNGVGAFMGIGVLVFQDDELVGNSFGDATLRATVWVNGFAARSAAGNVNVVPRAILQFAAHVVRPCRCVC
jgi:hypothetical protein